VFDAVVSFYAIFHVPRELQARVFADIFRSLKRGGYLLASVGRTDAGSYTEPDFFGVEMYWSHYGVDTYREMVKSSGFELLTERSDLTQACDSSDPARVVATIVWPAATTAEQTFLDMSDTNDFREGAYSSHGPLPAPATSFTLEGLAIGTTYFYRVRVIRDAAP